VSKRGRPGVIAAVSPPAATEGDVVAACAAEESVEACSTPFENPEIAAMTAICERLRQLPNDAARLRVMRWSFGRFAAEFKRPLPDGAPDPFPVAASPRPGPWRDLAPLAAVAPLDVQNEDFAGQLSELNDLFEPVPDLSDDTFF
jgi:hypothetical protein